MGQRPRQHVPLVPEPVARPAVEGDRAPRPLGVEPVLDRRLPELREGEVVEVQLSERPPIRAPAGRSAVVVIGVVAIVVAVVGVGPPAVPPPPRGAVTALALVPTTPPLRGGDVPDPQRAVFHPPGAPFRLQESLFPRHHLPSEPGPHRVIGCLYWIYPR